MSELGLYLNAAQLIALVGGTAGIMWKLRGVEREIRGDLEGKVRDLREDLDHRIERLSAEVENIGKDFELKIDKVTSESVGRAETLRKETGEMGAALRQKIHDVETWMRDTFVRKESFSEVIGRLEASLNRMTERLEKKIDAVAVLRQARPE